MSIGLDKKPDDKNPDDKVRPNVEIGALLAVVAVHSVVAWFLPEWYHRRFVLAPLAAGFCFDLMSAFYHIMTLVTGKFMSGFPLVGLFFYAWFLLASRFTLTGGEQQGLAGVLLFKLVDAAVLLGFHALCQSWMFLQKPRSEYQ
jgi:hypothetical protein